VSSVIAVMVTISRRLIRHSSISVAMCHEVPQVFSIEFCLR
jgi:hypothetical protein